MKPILFIDFDGVLCDDRFWRGMGTADYDRIQEFLILGNRPMMDRWMRGGHSSEEINAYLSEHLDIPYEKLWEVFVNDAKTMNISPEVLSAIGHLRSRYHTVLITVNMDSLERFTVPAHRLDTYFDVIVNSYNDGRFKSEEGGQQFLDTANSLRASIEFSYLIDDRDNNCEIFKSLGGCALKVDSDHSTLKHLQALLAQNS